MRGRRGGGVGREVGGGGGGGGGEKSLRGEREEGKPVKVKREIFREIEGDLRRQYWLGSYFFFWQGGK